MSLVAVVGDAATTTALALAVSWPAGDEVLLAELDGSGGDLAAWLDVPEMPGLAGLVSGSEAGAWPTIATQIQTTPAGVRVLVCPIRNVEATAVVREAAVRVVPTLSAMDDPVVVADCGRQQAGGLSPVVTQAGLVVIGVRQPRSSSRAAAARLDRVAELVDAMAGRSLPVVVALIGEEPYTAPEVAAFLGGPTGPVPTVVLADDPYGAAVLGGRPGTGRRVERSRLLRSARTAAAELAVRLAAARAVPQGAAS